MSGRADDAALRSALEAALAAGGQPARVRSLSRRVSDYSTSYTIEELSLELDGGRLELVFKDLRWGSLLADAREVRPRFLFDPRREIAVYEHVLAGAGLGTARCYGSAVDPAADRYWLFLENVRGPKLCHVGDFDAWLRAARWLAGLHARFAAGGEAAHTLQRLPVLRYDADFYRRWVTRALDFAAVAGSNAARNRAALGWLAGRYRRVVDRLASLGVTLIHGEFYASNVLLRPAPAGETRAGAEKDAEAGAASAVCPLDWELAAVAPGAFDLAALTAGNWDEAQQAALVKAYHDALTPAAGLKAPPLAELAEVLDYCRLHQAVQWLGWAARWSAPADQAQDWLGTAMALAAKLRL